MASSNWVDNSTSFEFLVRRLSAYLLKVLNSFRDLGQDHHHRYVRNGSESFFGSSIQLGKMKIYLHTRKRGSTFWKKDFSYHSCNPTSILAASRGSSSPDSASPVGIKLALFFLRSKFLNFTADSAACGTRRPGVKEHI